MATKRIQNSYQTTLNDFLKFDILVVCPSCFHQAIVSSEIDGDGYCSPKKVSCLHCGFNKLFTKSIKKIGYAYDPYFSLPLWLATPFEGEVLWAYNHAHLTFLQKHIDAKLRERNNQTMRNSTLGSRLPQWMASHKNRDAILKKIAELMKK